MKQAWAWAWKHDVIVVLVFYPAEHLQLQLAWPHLGRRVVTLSVVETAGPRGFAV
jgi:hypothetical protein